MTEASAKKIISAAQKALGRAIVEKGISGGEAFVVIEREKIAEALQILRDYPATAMVQLMDVCGADYPERTERFEIVYQLLSLEHNARLCVKTRTDENTPVPTAANVYSAAGWYEREAWDLFGVRFDGHPDLRRILTDYGFEGHPLRKDFPLFGHVEARYDVVERRVKYAPVKLADPFRDFSRTSPWQGMTDVMRQPAEKERKAGK